MTIRIPDGPVFGCLLEFSDHSKTKLVQIANGPKVKFIWFSNNQNRLEIYIRKLKKTSFQMVPAFRCLVFWMVTVHVMALSLVF